MTESGAGQRVDAEGEIARLYERLRSIARRQRREHGEAWTLNTTALVHEVWAQLEEGAEQRLAPQDFYAYAARAMRNLLVDSARRRLRPKHGGGMNQVDLEDAAVIALPALSAEQTLDLDEALAHLDAEHPRIARVVMLHYFAGLGFEQIAEELMISTRTVMRDWRFARAWLHQRLHEPV